MIDSVCPLFMCLLVYNCPGVSLYPLSAGCQVSRRCWLRVLWAAFQSVSQEAAKVWYLVLEHLVILGTCCGVVWMFAKVKWGGRGTGVVWCVHLVVAPTFRVQSQCTCAEHKNGYEVRWGPPGHCCPILAPLPGSHTKALPQLQSDQMIDNRSKYVQWFFAQYCDSPPHQPIAHILISLKILMNRIIIKTHWAEVRRAGYKRNPSHETWAQLASQRAARCTLWWPSSSS